MRDCQNDTSSIHAVLIYTVSNNGSTRAKLCLARRVLCKLRRYLKENWGVYSVCSL